MLATNRAPNLYRQAWFSVNESGTDMRWVPGGGVPFASQWRSANGAVIFTVEATGVVSIDAASGQQLVRLDLHGFTVLALPASPPSFTADGRWVMFLAVRSCSTTCPPSEPALFVVRSDGTRMHRVATGVDGAGWSPDGKSLVYSSRPQLFVIARDGSRRRVVASDSVGQVPAFSPSGRLIAYVCGPVGAVCLVKPDGSGHRPLAGGDLAASNLAPGQDGILWSPNEKWIAVRRYGPIKIVPVRRSRSQLRTPTAATSRRSQPARPPS